ncbi:MAG TPA: SGNH/GDSL hydrolase family protein [Solirubrobacterales bacterium]
MKGLLRVLFISVLLLFGAFTASPATADPPTTPVAPVQLALGDSWAAGTRATPPSEGYVPQLNEALKDDFNCSGEAVEQGKAGCPQLQLVNLAVPGATTPTLIANQLPVAEGLLELRNGNRDPRDDVEVTTLHIGGNDVTTPIIVACLTQDFILTGVLSETPCLSTINTLFSTYRANLTTVLSGLRNAAGDDDARIVIGTYDNPIFAPCPLAAIPRARDLADIALEGDSPQLAQGLHDIMGEVAANYDVEVAHVFGDLDGAQFWAGDCLHPNNLGYDQVTNAFLEVFGLAPSG